jgi:tetratricopeptide (TPR) repeat protein
MVHRKARQFEAAERAYRQSLAIEVQQGNRKGQADSLTELGNLSNAWGRPEQAVAFYRQAADICTALGDQRPEGFARNNIADTLRTLPGRADEARREILRAIECKRPFGHAALPWTSFAILHAIEQAAGNGAAAAAAWRQARDAYLAYRRDGGYAQSGTGKLCDAVWQAVQQGGASLGAAVFQQVTAKWEATLAVQRLQAILAGARDRTLADDPELYYRDSAELLLLLERLGG